MGEIIRAVTDAMQLYNGNPGRSGHRRALEAADVTPLDRIVVETDSPYMSPVPNRGKRNDSTNLPYVVEKLAERKGVSPEEMERIVWENGLRLFRLEGKV